MNVSLYGYIVAHFIHTIRRLSTMNSEKSVWLTKRITPERKGKLQVVAAKHSFTMSKVMDILIDRYLDKLDKNLDAL